MYSAVIWLVDGSGWSNQMLSPWLACLTVEEQLRYTRFIRPLRQREFLIGRVLLRFAIARLGSVAFSDVSIATAETGAPVAIVPRWPATKGDRPHISLSHSRGWVACAVSADTTIGLDIELPDPDRDFPALAAVAFGVSESKWLSRQPEAVRTAEFYKLWCAKEALFKLSSNVNSQLTQFERNNEGINEGINEGMSERMSERMSEPVNDGSKETSDQEGHLYAIPHQQLFACLCSTHPLAAPSLIELAGDSPYAWSQYADRHLPDGMPSAL
ncbi:4'-phosphopantetheinyl transferase family protein [Glaciimonas immobilis]|uniref:4'-phosphopantetheinyl transferase n=1 Tax=Glaciimonas immobilis TaxID=728004 RepID=A0A840RML0_9BURK|nr:4'-phosphopantetheinyl transferase superfamily protein [Glaciimonas immobilis]KAF3998844.1 4'-phosphopantetheinyl transferase superfamily protein [Glaciimonas immobilis]MBB5198236.1 4'-phosphopantetheinyl transferase [Glaciimonas immobilis]